MSLKTTKKSSKGKSKITLKKKKKSQKEPEVKTTLEIRYKPSAGFLKDLVYASQIELDEQAEKLTLVEADTKIKKGEPAHYFRFLNQLAKSMKPETIVEIGTYKGISAAMMALGCPTAKVITMDEQENLYSKRVLSSIPNIESWKTSGSQPLRDIPKVDLLFIDGNPDGSCFLHYQYWLPRMAKKSVILFDDINLNPAMMDFWQTFQPVAGEKIELPIHGEAGFGAVVIDN